MSNSGKCVPHIEAAGAEVFLSELQGKCLQLQEQLLPLSIVNALPVCSILLKVYNIRLGCSAIAPARVWILAFRCS